MTSISLIFILLIAYQVKHFLADYPLQGRYMLGKFKPGSAFVLPLLSHVVVHGIGTFLITVWFGIGNAFLFATFDAAIHFIMDRIKASPDLLGRFKPLTAATAPTATPEQWQSNTFFWWSLGFDQMVHHLTHYIIVYWVVSGVMK